MGNLKIKRLKRQLFQILQWINKEKTVEEPIEREKTTGKKKESMNFRCQWSSGNVTESWNQKRFNRKEEQLTFFLLMYLRY